MALKKKSQPKNPSTDFPVVGVGASAGGLEAFTKMLKAIPEKSGMAFVLVQHLAPAHESALPEILQRVTKIPVLEIPDEVKILVDTIYVIPSNKILILTDGVLRLSPRDSVKTNLIIDVFFTSLAAVKRTFAVGVILSGTGKDGTLGLKIIRENGGITIAQDQESAAFGDMPLSAVEAGVVDFVLPPEDVPGQLLDINKVSHTSIPARKKDDLPADDAAVFKQILSLIYQHSKVDFTYYKQNTIRRRIARRIALRKSEGLEDYVTLLQSDKSEVETLFQDILIPVTSFFRDENTFDALCGKIFPALFKHKTEDDSIRLWIAGCSTGEEAYSIAMCLYEFLGEKSVARKIQIFASDISENAIKKARAGVYSEEDVMALSRSRLKNFFTKSQQGYHVSQFIRDSCVFAVHNFLKDPPFAKVDFISCRNVFIYLDPFLQKKALTMFHYALQEGGMLMLGKSETIGAAQELFSIVSNSHKVYSRKSVLGRFIQVTTERKEETLVAQNKTDTKPEAKYIDFRKSAEAFILAKAPTSVIVDKQFDIVHIHGDITPFLMPSPGKPTFNVFKMAREGLTFHLRNVLHKAKVKSEPIKETIHLSENNNQKTVTIEVIPLNNTIEPHYLVFFTEVILPKEIATGGTRDTSAHKKADLRNQEYERELAQIRLDMRAITDEYDSVNDILQTANEELQSSNEELQSLNEELETSKEELQSANEELTTANQELIDKQEQLNESQNYAEAIVSTIREPLLVLDNTLHIKTANSFFFKKFKVRREDVEGKLIFDVHNSFWENAELEKLLREVLPHRKKMENFEMDVFLFNEPHHFILSAHQLVSKQKQEDLILLAMEDITHSIVNKRLQESEARFRQLAEEIPNMVWTATPDGTCTYSNKVMLEYTGLDPNELIGKSWHKVILDLDLARTLKLFQRSIQTGADFTVENRVNKHDGTYEWHLCRAVPQRDIKGNIVLWIGTFTNVQDQKNFSEKLEEKVFERTAELERTNNQLNQFAYTASHDLQEPLRKIVTFSKLLKQDDYEQLSEKVQTYIEKIENSSLRMSLLIRDLLNYSRVANAKELFEKTDLNVVLKNILNDFELLIKEKKAEIKSEKLPTIQAIPLQMNQLFYNLIGNALKFSKDNVTPVITITTRQLSSQEVERYSKLNPDLAYQEITFKDNGIGFDQQYAHQIFILFQRLNQPSQYSGTGIGLALSKKIVEGNHGEIYAQSVENEGSEFHVILPVSQKLSE